MIKMITQQLILSSCTIFIAFMPVAAQAENCYGPTPINCCETQDDCCTPCCIDNKILLGGSVLVGAAAGAIAAACKKGKKGSRGLQGDGQNVFFQRDDGQTLRFEESFTVEAHVKPGGFVHVTPLVIGPDNEVFQGAPMDVSAGGFFRMIPITIENPRFGFYQFGYEGHAVLANGTKIIPNVIEIFASRYPGENLRDFLPNGAEINTDNEETGTITAPFIYFKTTLPL